MLLLNVGRRKDPVWVHFISTKIPGQKLEKAKCKDCGSLVTSLVDRMKKHRDEDQNCIKIRHPQSQSDTDTSDSVAVGSTSSSCDSNNPNSTKTPVLPFQSKLGEHPLFLRTSAVKKQALDAQCARMIFGTNSAFRTVDHPEFRKFCEELRPGYTPPSRQEIGGRLLEKEFQTLQSVMKESLRDKTVCLSLDGWSNIQNDPIISACLTDPSTHEVRKLDLKLIRI